MNDGEETVLLGQKERQQTKLRDAGQRRLDRFKKIFEKLNKK